MQLLLQSQGRTQGEGPGARPPPPPCDLKNTIFSGFLPLNYVIYIFEVCFLCFLLCGRTEEAWSMVNSLRKVGFSHPTGHYTWEKISPPPPPWENPGSAPGCAHLQLVEGYGWEFTGALKQTIITQDNHEYEGRFDSRVRVVSHDDLRFHLALLNAHHSNYLAHSSQLKVRLYYRFH